MKSGEYAMCGTAVAVGSFVLFLAGLISLFRSGHHSFCQVPTACDGLLEGSLYPSLCGLADQALSDGDGALQHQDDDVLDHRLSLAVGADAKRRACGGIDAPPPANRLAGGNFFRRNHDVAALEIGG